MLYILISWNRFLNKWFNRRSQLLISHLSMRKVEVIRFPTARKGSTSHFGVGGDARSKNSSSRALIVTTQEICVQVRYRRDILTLRTHSGIPRASTQHPFTYTWLRLQWTTCVCAIWSCYLDDATVFLSDNEHAVSATLLHRDGAGGPGRSPLWQTGDEAQEPPAVPVRAGVHIHGSDHQPGQGESSTPWICLICVKASSFCMILFWCLSEFIRLSENI